MNMCMGFFRHSLPSDLLPLLLVCVCVCVPQVTGEATMLFLQVLFLMWRLDGKVRW